MRAGVFYTVDRSSVVSNAIRHVSGGEWSHCGMTFRCSRKFLESIADGRKRIPLAPGVELAARAVARSLVSSASVPDTASFLFESRAGRDSVTNRTGVRGPVPLSELDIWQAESPEKRAYGLQQIVLPKGANADELGLCAFGICAWASRNVSYAPLQLWWNYVGFRAGRGVPLGRRTSDKWTCVEMVVRALPPWYSVPLLGLGDVLYDEYAPSSGRLPKVGLYELIERSNCELSRQ